MKIRYSWILPVKDESESLPKLIDEIRKTMKGRSFEIIAVDDASEDKSYYTLQSARLFNLKVIRFITHQGKWVAIREGIKAAKGDIIITSDADLQDDPKEVKKLLAKFAKDYDLLSGLRKVRYDPYYKILLSKLGNHFVSILTGYKFKDLNSPFKIYKREVLENIPKEGSLLRFSMLFARKMGYKTAEVPITHRPRIYGKSKFGIIKYLRIFYDLLLVFLLFSGSGRLTRTK